MKKKIFPLHILLNGTDITQKKKKIEREEKKKKRVQNFFFSSFNAEFMRIHKKKKYECVYYVQRAKSNSRNEKKCIYKMLEIVTHIQERVQVMSLLSVYSIESFIHE